MTVAQKVPFELVALDGPASGFTDSFETAAALAGAIEGIAGLDRSRLLLFGGWESASRGAGSTLQMVGERLGIAEQFQGVDRITVRDDGSSGDPGARRRRPAPGFGVRRAAGGAGLGHREPARAAQQPAGRAWPTCAAIMPALQRAKAAPVSNAGLSFASVGLPKQQRETQRGQEPAGRRDRARNRRLDRGGVAVEPILLLAHTEADGTLAKPALGSTGGGDGAGRAS